MYGGVGPLHSDVALAGIAKAFGVRMVGNIRRNHLVMHISEWPCSYRKADVVVDKNIMALGAILIRLASFH